MNASPNFHCIAGAGLSLFLVACASEPPAPTATARLDAHAAMASDLSASAVAQALRALRAHTAPWHNPEKAAEAGYTIPVGCTDERTEGLPASLARGMGYHTLNLQLLDDRATLLQPELIVYGRNPANGKLQFAGFDYFIPEAFYPAPTSPQYPGQPPVLEGLGMPLMYNAAHAGWIAHIWPWLHNPDGMFQNVNPAIPICECQIDPQQALCTP